METPWANNHKGAGLLGVSLCCTANTPVVSTSAIRSKNSSKEVRAHMLLSTIESPSRLFSQPSSRSVASGVGYRRLRRPRMSRICPTVVPSCSGTMHSASNTTAIPRIFCRLPNLVHRQHRRRHRSCIPATPRDGESRWRQIDSRHIVASMMIPTSQAIAARLISNWCWGYSRIECPVRRA